MASHRVCRGSAGSRNGVSPRSHQNLTNEWPATAALRLHGRGVCSAADQMGRPSKQAASVSPSVTRERSAGSSCGAVGSLVRPRGHHRHSTLHLRGALGGQGLLPARLPQERERVPRCQIHSPSCSVLLLRFWKFLSILQK